MSILAIRRLPHLTSPTTKSAFSHGRSKIGLFLVIHGNNHTLFILKKKRFSTPRDVKESLPSLGIETISKKKPFHPQGGKRFLFKKYLSQKKKNQLHGRGKNPIRYLRKYRGLLFFSHAALEDKYEMLPTYCPRDELKFIPRAVIVRSIPPSG